MNTYIKAGANDAWVRPGGWVDIPSITSADTKFYGVYAVYETRKNNLTIQFFGTFNITINWGDGTPNTVVSSTAIQTKSYTYASLTSPILQDEYGQNYKTVLVTINQNSGAVTTFQFGTGSSIGTYNWLDIVMSWSTARPSFLKTHTLLQRFIQYTGNFNSSNINSTFILLPNCRVFQLPVNIGTPTQAQNVFTFLGNCEYGDMTISGAISVSALFSSSLIRKFGNISLPSASVITSLFSSCPNLKFFGDLSAPNTGNFQAIFSSCPNLIKVGTITSTSATSILNMFSFCYSLREATFTNLTNVTTTLNAFQNCFSLQNLRVPGLKVNVNFTDCAMERAALVQVFNDLGTPATTQTITVTRNPGSADLTAADILIATSKNWTVTL